MFLQILIPATGAATDTVVFETALAVSGGWQGHLEFLHVRPDPASAVLGMAGTAMDGGYALELMMETLDKDGGVAETAAQAAWAAFCSRSHLGTDGHPAPGRATAGLVIEMGDDVRGLIDRGLTSDIVVIGRPEGGEEVALSRLQEVLAGIGRPLLIAAPTCPPSLLETVVIAWKGTVEAARAVGAAMPFITRAETVLVLTVDEAADAPPQPANRASCDRLVSTLRLHTPKVRLQHVPLGKGTAAEALMNAAEEARASLLVMGAYGHGELREMVFGGFTRSVLSAAAMPVLMMR